MSADLPGEWREDVVGDGVIRYLRAGLGSPVILLHGLSGSVAWWQRNIEALAEAHQVFAIDLVYHGGRAASRFALGRTAERLARWMVAASLSKAAIIGHSMGGHIATCIAAQYPELVNKVVLVSAATLFPAAGLPVEPRRVIRWLPTFPVTLAPFLLRDALRAGPLTLWEASRDLVMSDLRPCLGNVVAATLIIWGARDGLLPVELAHELHAALPHSELRIFPTAGHNPMWEAPAEFNDLVLAFLRPPG